ncbi:transcriptional regulator [Pyrodictium delaneyi]|uniref:Transcriptional regulator n=2 Tax=Pyrodictium delaneyi TaxID=1273541 RepID=A0A211YQA9_9CREN|nr:transcriptional regulator [Pyrodictium delaneyi]
MSEHPGSVLRKWREIFAASQLDVARHMGVTPSVISDYEKGRRTPGSLFIRRFVEALLDIDSERGWSVVSRLAKMLQLNYLGAVIDMREFETGVTLEEIITRVKGIPINSYLLDERIYGYTIVDSLKAIMSLTGSEFLHLLGSTTQRVVVFTRVTTGRSPMIALRVSTIKPAAIVLHGPRKLDYLAVWMAESERIPVILSMARNIEELVKNLRQLVFSPR